MALVQIVAVAPVALAVRCLIYGFHGSVRILRYCNVSRDQRFRPPGATDYRSHLLAYHTSIRTGSSHVLPLSLERSYGEKINFDGDMGI
jgi:hypothetical protein